MKNSNYLVANCILPYYMHACVCNNSIVTEYVPTLCAYVAISATGSGIR